jgi:hypothetical protein
MAIDARAISNVREPRDISPGIRNLQLAFQQGILSGEEIANAVTTSPQEKLAGAQAAVGLNMLPLQAKSQQLALQADIAAAPSRQALAEMELRGKAAKTEAALAIQPDVFENQRLQVQDQVEQISGLLGSQPFASTENALAFYRRTRPGEKVPESADEISKKNREAFDSIQEFRNEMRRFTGKPTVETFEEIDPETYDKHRVRVQYDASGREIGREILGVTEIGEKSLTEQQANGVQFAARMKQAEANVDALEEGGYNAVGMNEAGQQIASRLGLSAVVNSLGIPGMAVTPEAQRYEAAKRNWMAAVLRKESGAAIAASEYSGANQQYFPQPGDAPEVVAQKRTLRSTALATMQGVALMGLPPAQQAMITEKFQGVATPTKGDIKSEWKVVSDSEFAEMEAIRLGKKKATPGKEFRDLSPAELAGTPAASAAPAKLITVRTAADVSALPPDVEFFRTPDGRNKRNPNFRR